MAQSELKQEVTVREFPRVGRYRVRLRRSGRTGRTHLELREYLETSGFSGFTQRGVSVCTQRQAAELAETLKQVLEDELLPVEALDG